MAACLITIAGTSGKVLLKYNESATAKELSADIGSIFLDDVTVTDVTYTTLYGDAVASSACFTITELPLSCYHLTWDHSDLDSYEFVSVDLDGVVHPIGPVSFPDVSLVNIANAINSLDNDSVKAVQGNVNAITHPNFTLVLRTLSTDAPILKVKRTDTTTAFYIHGVSGACSTLGYTDYDTCQPIILS